MAVSSKVCGAVLLFMTFPGCFLANAQAASGESLGDVARELRLSKNGDGQSKEQSTRSPNRDKDGTSAVISESPEPQRLMDQAKSLLLREEFPELDKLAESLRSTKARFPGGGWQLTRLYEAVSNVNSSGNETDADWTSHLALLQRWAVSRPQSITARLALADAYLRYAWVARGEGYANTVTDGGWRLFQERTQQSSKALSEAANLPAKCPYWYELAQEIALASGADSGQQRAIFEKAVRFEPLYFAYYQRYAITLLPKWGGTSGELESFANESIRRVGGKQGAYIYFEIASNLCGRCGEFSPDEFSWQTLQDGFGALEEFYGLSPLKVNRFAFLASSYGDKAVAAKAFERIGSNWDYTVWGTRARFESQRVWAGLPPSPPATAATAPRWLAPPPNAQVEQMLMLANKDWSEGHWDDAIQIAHKAIQVAEPLPGSGGQLGRAYVIVANSEYSKGHVVEAQAMLEKAEVRVAEKAGAESVELAAVLAQVALSAQIMNDYQRAEKDLLRAIAIREKVNGPSDPEFANDLTILGNVYLMRGRDKDAIEQYQRAISARETVKHDDFSLIGPLGQLGMIYERIGRNEDAEKSFLRELHLMEGQFGLNSPALADPLSKLANVYQSMGKTDSEHQMQARLQAIQRNKAN